MLNIDFFSIEDKYRIPAPGKVLISEPFLADANFRRSVVFLTEHGKKGSMGFILNKPIKTPIYEIVTDFPEVEFQVTYGGPVATNTLHYIHVLGDVVPDSVRVMKNVYWGGEYESIKKMISLGVLGQEQIRFFVGYAGWGEGQLAREISEGSWIVTDLQPELVMSGFDPVLWNEILQGMEGKYRLWAGYPENPGLN